VTPAEMVAQAESLEVLAGRMDYHSALWGPAWPDTEDKIQDCRDRARKLRETAFQLLTEEGKEKP
jgi:hypothetical protein